MPTPRSESTEKALHHHSDIREPTSRYDAENKIDHYAVLSQIITSGIDRYLSNPDYQSALQDAHSIANLDVNLRIDIKQIVLLTLKDADFAAHHQSLITSVKQRRSFDESLWPTIENNLTAGVDTFVSSTSYVFDILRSRLNPNTAANPNNWHILDKLAKLNLTAFSAYFRTYLPVHQNWSVFMSQLQESEDGSWKFSPGYPNNAPINKIAAENFVSSLSSGNLMLHNDLEKIALKDIQLDKVTIGCPVTFESGTVKKLWETYASQAHRILTTPAISSSGGNEASAQ